jgi:hypothetical protein
MRNVLIILLFIAILTCSGCNFSLLDAGFISEDRSAKIGLIGTDLMTENAINEFIEFEEKQKREEDLKDEGIVFGIFFQRKF